ncbi:MAG: hypothetical protein SFW35_00950 [Chitinophagales bacterium]|nr:hypothetical protein [Chitinophagales bacterium]
MKFIHLFLAMLVLGIAGCIDEPNYPDEPVIEFASVSRDTLYASQFVTDSVLITVNFTDGDGDIGSDDSDGGTEFVACGLNYDSICQVVDTVPGFNLFALDNRSNNGIKCIKPSRIPFVPENGSSKAISGDMTFFATVNCLSGPVDTLSYQIMIRDRAGHCSNIVRTQDIIVICQ